MDRLRTDTQNLRKKTDFLQSLLNKQTDYFDEHMFKMSNRFDSVANLEKRLSLHLTQLELVPQLQTNLLDIRDNQLPALVEDLRR